MFTESLAIHPLDLLPEHHRRPARDALQRVVGETARASLEPVTGGASGALVHRVDIDGAPSLLLRIETARDTFRDPHRSYVCLRTAADAGVAPPVHLADPDTGIVIMEFIHQRPIAEHPGGAVGVVRELGTLVARLQATPTFPPLLDDFGALLGQMLSLIDEAGVFAPGVLAPVHDGLARIDAAYPWDRAARVSGHNDINPFNVLYDGARLWLIDWEIAFRNDVLADVACVANNFSPPGADPTTVAAFEDALVQAWLGHAPDEATRSRLTLMRQLNRLFYGCLMMSTAIGALPAETDLDALTAEAFGAEIASGRLALGSPRLLHTMGKMQLAGFLAGFAADGFDRTLRAARG
jgi:aminoglycoside phosphotransferase (APT) family kinase protein